MNVVLTNEKGVVLCGSDGRFWVDGRLGYLRLAVAIDEYRQRFKKNFRWKFDYWTHFGTVATFRDDPKTLHRIG